MCGVADGHRSPRQHACVRTRLLSREGWVTPLPGALCSRSALSPSWEGGDVAATDGADGLRPLPRPGPRPRLAGVDSTLGEDDAFEEARPAAAQTIPQLLGQAGNTERQLTAFRHCSSRTRPAGVRSPARHATRYPRRCCSPPPLRSRHWRGVRSASHGLREGRHRWARDDVSMVNHPTLTPYAGTLRAFGGTLPFRAGGRNPRYQGEGWYTDTSPWTTRTQAGVGRS